MFTMYEYIRRVFECTEMAITEFLLFVFTATLFLGGMFLYGANDFINNYL